MLTTYDRVMQEYKRKVRLEAALCARESDRRDQAEVWTWVRDRSKRVVASIAIACFSLTFMAACSSAVTYEVRTCPLVMTATGCEQWLQECGK